RSSVPCGPLTVTRRSLTVTSTAEGNVIGALPMRDMTNSSPHVAEDLTADAPLTRLTVGHETLAGRQDGHTETAEHSGQLVGTGVDTQSRLRHPPETGDGPSPIRRILHVDLERPARPARRVLDVKPPDVALPRQDGSQRLLELRGGHADAVV